MIARIMSHEIFCKKPPVFIDVGASGGMHKEWKALAPFAVCIGFDADDRKTDFIESEDAGYLKLFVFNKLVSEVTASTEFYLTSSPYCSSRLEPNAKELSCWAFGELFEVEKKISLQATTIHEVLKQLNLDYIDWYKTDSQGTDLRIFRAIPDDIRSKIIIAEFEPGIINAYKNEDMLFDLMLYMQTQPFWMSKMTPKGSQRFSGENMRKYFPKYLARLHDFRFLLEESSSWAEVIYVNTFANFKLFDKRDILLGCAIAIVNKQYGFAIDLAEKGKLNYSDLIFNSIIHYSLNQIKKRRFSIYMHKIINKLKQYLV